MNIVKLISIAAPLAFVATSAAAQTATAEERARCEAVVEKAASGQHSHAQEKGVVATAPKGSKHQMGTKTQHSHAEQKGTLAQTPMNKEHARCAEIMGAKK